MVEKMLLSLFELLMCLSGVMDLVSNMVVNHQKRVSYIALRLAAELGLSIQEQDELVMAGALHDCGTFSLKERLDILQFDTQMLCGHAEVGYQLLKNFPPLKKEATLVRYHHLPWQDGRGIESAGEPVPMGSHILHLADRIDILIDKDREILGQVCGIRKKIQERSGSLFVPGLVEAFLGLSSKEYFWLDLSSPFLDSILLRRGPMSTIELGWSDLLSLTNLFCQIIDFRSPFTATHSSGVAASAEALSQLAGFSEHESRMMKIAGFLHDLGKLVIPSEILEKRTKLTESEFNLIRSHSFYTYRILENISDLSTINAWGSFHHERMDGQGYPFHYRQKDLPLGSRIMAVADVFTAMNEDRPYRKGMTKENVLQVLQEMARTMGLDPSMVFLLKRHYDDVNDLRIRAQEASHQEYRDLLSPGQ
ncbi:MAG: HD domain-containing phosphohydrolase [bacterium]